MNPLLEVQQKLLPELMEIMQHRYSILKTVRFLQPIGRRNLAVSLDVSERVLRSEVEFLQQQGLLHISQRGMTLTDTGRDIVEKLEDFMKELSGLEVIESKLKEKLELEKVIVVPGDSDSDQRVKHEMGKACATLLTEKLHKESIIAVTGGTTIAAVAEMMKPIGKDNVPLFVPARGGLGKRVESQANSICATMARKANGDYHLLHVPDELSEETYQMMIEEPGIKDVLEIIRSASIVIHGIGEAKTMAKRRKSSSELLGKLENENAVAEAFGYYFNQDGQVIHKLKTIGLQLDDLKHTNSIIAVAGGSSKANAIAAYMKQSPRHVLITDEGAARKLVSNV